MTSMGTAREYLSCFHLHACRLHVENSRIIEEKLRGNELSVEHRDKLFMEYHSYSLSAVLTSCAYFEATINELFSDACAKQGGYIDHREFWQPHPDDVNKDCELGILPMKPELRQKLEQAVLSREIGNCRYQTDRYNLALKLAGKREIRQNEAVLQDMIILVKLRNDLTHYRPQTTELLFDTKNNIMNAHTWEWLLDRLPSNDVCKFMFAPQKFLNYTVAKWAKETSTNFTAEFFRRLEVTNYCDAVEIQEQEHLKRVKEHYGSLDEYYKSMRE